MGKYKDALIEVSKDCKGYAMEWGFSKGACSKSLQLLKELVMEKELKLELEDVKKEWENLGYDFIFTNSDGYDDEDDELIYLYKINREIFIWKDKTFSFDNDTQSLTLLEHQLLSRTFKALGWFDDENR